MLTAFGFKLSLCLKNCEDCVKSRAWAEGGRGLGVVGLIITTDVGRFTLHGDELGHDLLFGGGELRRKRRENS